MAVQKVTPCPICEGRGAWYRESGQVCSPKNTPDNGAMLCPWCEGTGNTIPFPLLDKQSDYSTWLSNGGSVS